MKIAVRQIAFGSCLLAAGLLAAPEAFRSTAKAMPVNNPTPAATGVSTPSSPASATTVAQNTLPKLASPATANASAPAPIPTSAVAPEIKLPDLSTPLPGDKKDIKINDPLGAKVPDSVKDVIKKLNVKSEDITLDDLNNAREAVAKLDALIDIEKRLVDLDKIKTEREESNKNALMAALPASALTPPPSFMPPPVNQEARQMPVFTPPPSNVDVERIEGSNRHYAALVKEGDNSHLVRAGDKLNDGSTVVSVTPRGVELQRGDKAMHLVEVKDVETVFGGSP